MKYFVLHQGVRVKNFLYFFDAWLYCYLDLKSWSQIKDLNNNVWVVNPYSAS